MPYMYHTVNRVDIMIYRIPKIFAKILCWYFFIHHRPRWFVFCFQKKYEALWNVFWICLHEQLTVRVSFVNMNEHSGRKSEDFFQIIGNFVFFICASTSSKKFPNKFSVRVKLLKLMIQKYVLTVHDGQRWLYSACVQRAYTSTYVNISLFFLSRGTAKYQITMLYELSTALFCSFAEVLRLLANRFQLPEYICLKAHKR